MTENRFAAVYAPASIKAAIYSMPLKHKYFFVRATNYCQEVSV